MNSFKHRPAHTQDFEASTRSNLSRAGDSFHEFQCFDWKSMIDGPDDFSKTLSALGDKPDPVRCIAIPQSVSLLLHFESLAVQEGVDAINHLGGEVALDREGLGTGQRGLSQNSERRG